MYSVENWRMNQKIEKKCTSFKNKILQNIYTPTLEDV